MKKVIISYSFLTILVLVTTDSIVAENVKVLDIDVHEQFPTSQGENNGSSD